MNFKAEERYQRRLNRLPMVDVRLKDGTLTVWWSNQDL
jgi:hypothetical protein